MPPQKTPTTAVTSSSKQEEPIKEIVRIPRHKGFGGNLGGFFWTFFIPSMIYWYYGMTMLKKGQLCVPNYAFWHSLWYDLPEGLAIRPTWKGLQIMSLWVFIQFLFQQFLPGKISLGAPLKNGKCLKYKLNGWKAWTITLCGVSICIYNKWLNPLLLAKNFGSCLTVSLIGAYLLAIYLYIHFGLLWKRWQKSPEYEADWGVFSLKDFWADFWMGTCRNPRIFHFLGYPLDLKFFFEARPGLLLWMLNNFSQIAMAYYTCTYNNTTMSCSLHGSWKQVPFNSIVISFMHFYYILDYFWNEEAILTTTDIRHETFGFMLAYGDFAYLPWYYCLAFTQWLVMIEPWLENTFCTVVGCIIFLCSMIGFRVSNIQKHQFRTHWVKHKNCDNLKIFGVNTNKPITFIETKEGSVLLTAGLWGKARHPNYLPDMLMCLGWLIMCLGKNQFPWIPLSYVMYFWTMDIHRFLRDEARCLKKYGNDWLQYKKEVPYALIPGVF